MKEWWLMISILTFSPSEIHSFIHCDDFILMISNLLGHQVGFILMISKLLHSSSWNYSDVSLLYCEEV